MSENECCNHENKQEKAKTESSKLENTVCKIECRQLAHCIAELDITLEAKPVKDAYQKAVQLVNKKVSIPGFRKGRAPEKSLIHSFAEAIDSEWKSLVRELAYTEALKLSNYSPLNQDSITKFETKEISKDNGAHIFMAFEHYPNIPKVELKEIQIKKVQTKEVDDKSINSHLISINIQHCEKKEITDRPAQEGDICIVSLSSKESEGKNEVEDETKVYLIKDFNTHSKSDTLFHNALVSNVCGMKIGESKDLTLPPQAFLEDPEAIEKAKSKDLKLHLILKNIDEPSLLSEEELNKKLNIKDTDELKEKIKKSFIDKFAAEAKEELKNRIHKTLGETFSFDLPSKVLASQNKVMLKRHIDMLKEKNHVSDEDIATNLDEIKKSIHAEAERALRFWFFRESLVNDLNFKVEEAEISAMMQEQLQIYMSGGDSIFRDFDPKDPNSGSKITEDLRNIILHHKFWDHLIEQVSFSDPA